MILRFRFAAAAAAALLAWGTARATYDRANFDPSVRPQDDFYHYANGTWLKTHPIPAAYSEFGAFDEVVEFYFADAGDAGGGWPSLRFVNFL